MHVQPFERIGNIPALIWIFKKGVCILHNMYVHNNWIYGMVVAINSFTFEIVNASVPTGTLYWVFPSGRTRYESEPA